MNISPVNSTNFKALIVRGQHGEPDRKYEKYTDLPNAQTDAATGLPLYPKALVVFNTETGKESVVYPTYDLNQMKLAGYGPKILAIPGYSTHLSRIDGYRPEDLV